MRIPPRGGAAPLFAALAVAPPVLPEPPAASDPIELVWDAPPGCPDVQAVRERLARFVPTEPTEQRVRADARVHDEAGELVLTLRIDDGLRTESRTLRSHDCEALARATGLVIAVAIDPVGVARELRDDGAVVMPEPPRPAEPAPPFARPPDRPRSSIADRPAPRSRVESARDTTRTRPRLPVRFGARPELLVGGGLLPGPIGLGVAGTFAVFGRSRPWRAELGGAYWFPRRARIADVPTAGGDIWLAHGRASGCGVPALPRVEFPICAGLDLGAAGGTGFGPGVDTRTNADLFVGVHAGVGAAWAPIPALALFARIEGVVALNRPAFQIEGVGDESVHRLGAAGARGAIGLEVRFFR